MDSRQYEVQLGEITMKIFTEEFKDLVVTATAWVVAHVIVFGPLILLIILAIWFAERGY